jgi:energy-coupling factor transporter transmembrane protein EcfT
MYSKEYSFIDMNTIVFEFVFFIFYLKLIVFTTTKDEYGKGSSVLVNIFNLIGLSTRRIANWFSNIPAFFQCFFDSVREVFISSDNKGRYYTHSNIINKIYLFFFYFKNIFSLTKEKMKLRKEEKKYKLYNKKRKSRYQYRYKLKLADYIFVIIYIGLMIFYVLKVR